MNLAFIIVVLATPIISAEPYTSGQSPLDLELLSGGANKELQQAEAQFRDGDYAEAISVFQKVADQGHVGAAYILGRIYEGGHGVAPDPEKAAALYEANIDRDHAPSMIALGELAEDDSPGEALQLYRQAAALGEPIADFKLGDIYERGLLGVRANPKLAYFHFEKLSDTDLSVAHFRLARCYDQGIGVSPDALRATKLYRKAALGGHVSSQVIMSRRYFEGKGLDPDAVAAVGWLTRACQFGSAEARVLLGLRYENGDAVLQDLNMAGQLYSAAAKQGDPTAQYHLARLYAEGLGTPADPVRAYVLLARAQALPAAQEAFAKLESELTPEQLDLAKRKVAEAQNEESSLETAPAAPTLESPHP